MSEQNRPWHADGAEQYPQREPGCFRPDYGPAYQQSATGPAYTAPTEQFAQGVGYGTGPYGPAASPPPPSPPPRRGRKIPLPVLISCAAALVLAVGGFLITSGGSTSPTASAAGSGNTATGKLTTLWAAGGTAGSNLEDFSASWATSDEVVDARVDGAIAYQLWDAQTHQGGVEKWGWQVPAGDQACAMSTGTVGGIGVIAYGDVNDGNNAQACDQLVGLNVETGSVLWTIDLDPNTSSNYSVIKVSDPYISISGDTLAVQGEDQRLDVFDLKTGKLRWATPDEVGNLEANVCNPEGIAVAAQTVYELESCLSTSAGGGQSNIINAYPAEATSTPTPTALGGTGSLSTVTPPELWQAGNYVLAVGFGATSVQEILAYDVAGGAGPPVSLSMSDYSQDAFQSSEDGQLNSRAWAVYGNTLYVEDQGNGNDVNGVAALSLSTGKQLWDKTPGGNTGSTIVDAGSEGVRVIMSVPLQSGYRLATLAAATGQVSYGAGTSDNRFFIDGSNSSLYIEGTYFINIEDDTTGGTPGVVVLSGVEQ